MSGSATNYGTYKKVDVETASQGKLIVMLFNGAIQRAEEAKRQLEKGRIQAVHGNLVRAQEIMAELRGALNMQAGGDVARNLDRVYEYCQHLLIVANLRKDVSPIDQAVEFMTTMRDAWHELFEHLAREETPAPPVINQHGAAALNMQG